MLEYYADKLSLWMCRYSNVKKEVLKYGIEIILSTVLQMFVMAIIAYFIFDLRYAFIFFAVFIPLRGYLKGYHCKTFERCFLLSNLIFLATAYLSKYLVKYQNSEMTILTVLTLIFTYILVKSFKDIKSKQKSAKKLLTISSVIYLIIIICMIFNLFAAKEILIMSMLSYCDVFALHLINEILKISKYKFSD